MPSAPGCALSARLRSVRRASWRVWWRKAPLFPGRMPIRGGVPGKTGRREGKRRAALDAVGWLPRGLFAARFAGDGRRSRGGPRWGGTGAFAFGRMRLRFGGCPFLLRREESFVDGCGDGGPREKPRALSARGFLMGLSALDVVRWPPPGAQTTDKALRSDTSAGVKC